jgi:hypothetical protein
VAFHGVAVPGEPVARHGVRRVGLFGGIDEPGRGGAPQAEAHHAEVAVSEGEHVLGGLRRGRAVVDADPRHVQRRAAWLVDHDQRQLPGDGRGEYGIVVGQRADDQPVDDRAGDRGGAPPAG